MLASGFPVALQCRNTSLSASTDTLAVFSTVIQGFAPTLSAPKTQGKGGAAVGRRELIRPATKRHIHTAKKTTLLTLFKMCGSFVFVNTEPICFH